MLHSKGNNLENRGSITTGRVSGIRSNSENAHTPRERAIPDLPFWHLQRDDAWEVPEAYRITRPVSFHAQIASLRRAGVQGGFPADAFLALRQN